MQAGGWQPIETAPKDGSKILVYRTGREPFIVRADDLIHLRASDLPRSPSRPSPRRLTARHLGGRQCPPFSIPQPGPFGAAHDGRALNKTRVLGSQSRASGVGGALTPEASEAVTYSRIWRPGLKTLRAAKRRLWSWPYTIATGAPGARSLRQLGGSCSRGWAHIQGPLGCRFHSVVVGHPRPSSSPLPEFRSSLIGHWQRSFSECRKNEGLL